MMKSRITRLTIGTSVGLMLVSGCATTRPIVYPNERAREVGPSGVAADIDECLRLGEEFTSGGGRGEQVAKDAAGRGVVSAGVGAAVGAAGGAIYGDAARGAAAGAAGGATAGVLSAVVDGVRRREPDRVYANFVTRCLSEKGYQVLGWE